MDPIPPFSTFGKASSELVHDDDFAVDDHVLSLEMEIPEHLDGSFDVFIEIDEGHQSNILWARKGSDPLAPARG